MVERCTEIPVSVGIAGTKVLAKVANKIAKKSAKARGVLNLFKSPHLEKALARTDVGDIWYVGPAYERMLKENGINNALEFRNAPEHWVRAKMTVVGARIQSELKGVSCLPMELLPPAKKMVGTAQGFGALIETLEELKEAAATRASEEALKLRKEKQCVKELTIWIQTNPFGHDPQYGDARTVVFPVATNDTSTLDPLRGGRGGEPVPEGLPVQAHRVERRQAGARGRRPGAFVHPPGRPPKAGLDEGHRPIERGQGGRDRPDGIGGDQPKVADEIRETVPALHDPAEGLAHSQGALTGGIPRF